MISPVASFAVGTKPLFSLLSLDGSAHCCVDLILAEAGVPFQEPRFRGRNPSPAGHHPQRFGRSPGSGRRFHRELWGNQCRACDRIVGCKLRDDRANRLSQAFFCSALHLTMYQVRRLTEAAAASERGQFVLLWYWLPAWYFSCCASCTSMRLVILCQGDRADRIRCRHYDLLPVKCVDRGRCSETRSIEVE